MEVITEIYMIKFASQITIVYIVEEVEEEEKPVLKQSKQPPASKKAKAVPKGKGKAVPNFTHKWLASSLKGHSAKILDMDFSPNGKYVLTVAEGNNLALNLLSSCYRYADITLNILKLIYEGVEM